MSTIRPFRFGVITESSPSREQWSAIALGDETLQVLEKTEL
jgi:hypothetical protein